MFALGRAGIISYMAKKRYEEKKRNPPKPF